MCFFIFFFSSRRRHTRSYGDWSSDVCSSDLLVGCAVEPGLDDAVMLQDQLAVRRARAARLGIVLADVPEAVHEQALGEPGPLDLVEAFELRGEEVGLVDRPLAGG